MVTRNVSLSSSTAIAAAFTAAFVATFGAIAPAAADTGGAKFRDRADSAGQVLAALMATPDAVTGFVTALERYAP